MEKTNPYFKTKTIDALNINYQDIIINIDKIFSFCKICKKSIKAYKSHRHFNEIHLSISECCPYCGIKIKRLTPHLNNHCKKFNNKIDGNIDFHSIITNIFSTKFSINNSININNNQLLYNNKNNNFNVNINPTNEEKEKLKFISSLYNELLKLYKSDLSQTINDFYTFKSFSLGKGSFDQINFGLNPETKQCVAIKIYKNNDKECFNNEINNLKRLDKYNIFPKIIKFNDSDELGFYFAQTLKRPNLKNLFIFQKNYFDALTILNIASDLLICLSVVHKEKIFHSDLSPLIMYGIFLKKIIMAQILF